MKARPGKRGSKSVQTRKKKNLVCAGTSEEELFFSRELASQQQQKNKILSIIDDVLQTIGTLDIQKCPFCGNHTATYHMQQRRSMDEGATAEYSCTTPTCARTWRGAR